MKKKIKIFLKAVISILIALAFVIPPSTALLDDTEPPEITNIYYEPLIALIPEDPFIWMTCTVTDNVDPYAADVRINISGPEGLSVNDSMYQSGHDYDYWIYPVTDAGAYLFYICANDSSGNWASTDTYTILILEDYLSEVHVDDDNTQGPWNGSEDYPFQRIRHGLLAVAEGGTVFLHDGVYIERPRIEKQISLIGDSKENTIIDGTHIFMANAVELYHANYITVTNLTIKNATQNGIYSLSSANNILKNIAVFDCVETGIIVSSSNISECEVYNNGESGISVDSSCNIMNCTVYDNTYDGINFGNSNIITDCTIYNNSRYGLKPSGYNTITNCDVFCNSECGVYIASINNILKDCDIYNNPNLGVYVGRSGNHVYHNNFINNTMHANGTNIASEWDNGTTGNYWDDYQDRYPNATIDPVTGTWETPYVIREGYHQDNHPWVFPNGDRDEIPPEVDLIYPNGGEAVSDIVIIKWTAEDDYARTLNGTIIIEYSDDAGSTWFEIDSYLDNTGIYYWNTTGVANGEDYLIRVSATDEFGNTGYDESDDVFTIYNPSPILEIGEITGGLLQVSTEIKNTGDAIIENVEWQINVKGGIFKLINVSATDIIDTLLPDDIKTGIASPIFGLGKIEISIVAFADNYEPVEKAATALVLGPLVLGILES